LLLALVVMLYQALEGPLFVEQRNDGGRCDRGSSGACQPGGRIAQELLDAAVLRPIDRAGPSRIGDSVTPRKQMALLEIDVRPQAALVFLEQPLCVRPTAVDQGFLMQGEEIAQGEMVPEEQIDRIGFAVHACAPVARPRTQGERESEPLSCNARQSKV
jgi:hypothetical protein